MVTSVSIGCLSFFPLRRIIVGTGAMTEWLDIVKIVVDEFGLALKDMNVVN